MTLYISITKVKELIVDVLEPVMIEAKKESEYAK
jgi:hypothetical protein